MNAVATPARAGSGSAAGVAEERLFEAEPTGGATLEQRIVAAWNELTRSGAADCPVCGARVRAEAACERCGSELS